MVIGIIDSGGIVKVDWLFLDLNSYFASCEQQENPKLRGKPVAVVPMMADTTCCLAASYEAKRLGIKTGTMVREARQKCPGIVFLPARHEIYVKYHHLILDAVERVTPIDKVWSIDEMACQLMGSEKDLELAKKLSLKIKESIYKNAGDYLRCSIGLSSNTLLAKMASDMKKPDGLTVLLKENLPGALHSLQLRDVPGIGSRMEARLNCYGVFTMQVLCSLSKEQMRSIWGGIVGERYYHLLKGEDLEIAETKTSSIGHQHVLAPDTRTRDGVIAYLKRLTAKAAFRLRDKGLFTRKISVHVKYMKENTYFAMDVRVAETQSTLVLLKIVEEICRQLPHHKPIRVGVVLTDFIKADKHQLSLFESEKENEISYAMDSINDKFGKNAVFFGGVPPKTETKSKIAFSRIPEQYELE